MTSQSLKWWRILQLPAFKFQEFVQDRGWTVCHSPFCSSFLMLKCLKNFCFCHLFLWGAVTIFIRFRACTGSLLLACGVVGGRSFMQCGRFHLNFSPSEVPRESLWKGCHRLLVSQHKVAGEHLQVTHQIVFKGEGSDSFWVALVQKMYVMRHRVTSNETSTQI